jgi:hypothetical protein
MIGRSADREKVALGIGELVQDNIHHGDAETWRETGSVDREICGSGHRVIWRSISWGESCKSFRAWDEGGRVGR